jgi:6-phosphogluconolactonase
MQLIISKDLDELSQRVADWLVDYIRQTIEELGRFTLVLSGGSTPKKLHLLLASPLFKDRIDWQRVHFFWGDERYVPFTDERNNAKMAFDTLLDHVPVNKSQIHLMRTDIDASASAEEYESVLSSYFPEAAGYIVDKHETEQTAKDAGNTAVPFTFDLVLLGLGGNAHTLSLFPGEEVIHEKHKWVRAVYVKEVNMQRITLTAPVVNLARRILFLVSGQDKAEALSHILLNAYVPDLYPAQVIKPVAGELFWFVDQPAAERITQAAVK